MALYEFRSNTSEGDPRSVAERTCIYDTETDELFVPGGICDDPATVFLCASYDGIEMIRDEDSDYPYFPISWLMREYPASKETLEGIREKVKSSISQEP